MNCLAQTIAWCLVIAFYFFLTALGSALAALANKFGIAVLAYFGIML